MTLNNASALQNQQVLLSLLDFLATFYHDKITPSLPVPKGLVVESTGGISAAGSARRLLVPHGGLFKNQP